MSHSEDYTEELRAKIVQAAGYPVPEEDTKTGQANAREWLERVAQAPSHATTVEGWGFLLGLAIALNLPRSQAENSRLAAIQYQIAQTFAADVDTLPLLQAPSGEPWPPGTPMPPHWGQTLIMRKDSLRTWAEKHRPDWLGLIPLASGTPTPDTQDEVHREGMPQADIVKEMVELKRKDAWFHAIKACIEQYQTEHDATPTADQLWATLHTDPPAGYCITPETKKGTHGLSIAGGKHLDYRAFKERYRRIFPRDCVHKKS